MTESEMRQQQVKRCMTLALKAMHENNPAEARYWLDGASLVLQSMENNTDGQTLEISAA